MSFGMAGEKRVHLLGKERSSGSHPDLAGCKFIYADEACL